MQNLDLTGTVMVAYGVPVWALGTLFEFTCFFLQNSALADTVTIRYVCTYINTRRYGCTLHTSLSLRGFFSEIWFWLALSRSGMYVPT